MCSNLQHLNQTSNDFSIFPLNLEEIYFSYTLVLLFLEITASFDYHQVTITGGLPKPLIQVGAVPYPVGFILA